MAFDRVMQPVNALLSGAQGALSLLGLVVLGTIVARIVAALYTTFLRRGKNLKAYGQWAVVTGATDGIGKAYASELAKRGLSVFLISRTESKLVEVEQELLKKYPKVKVQHLAVDYSKFDEAAQGRVAAALEPLDVGVLINNVGMSYPHPKYLDEVTDAEMEGLLQLNVQSTVYMTRIVLPAMLKKKKGAIVNLASAAAMNATPLLSGYSGAKGFILKLSESLHWELAPRGVHVQCQVPLLVATKLAKIRKASWDKPSPQTYARVAIKSIGYEAVTSPYWSHKLQLWVMSSLPTWVTTKVVFNMHASMRKRALKKAEGKKA